MEPLTRFQEDALADLLQSVHLKSSLYCRAKMRAPWGFHVSTRIASRKSSFLCFEQVCSYDVALVFSPRPCLGSSALEQKKHMG
jgi:hypothetical protein